MENEYTERLIRVEERAKSNSHRLDELEPIVNEIHAMSNTMIQLVEEVKHTNETVGTLNKKMDKMDNRVDAIERSPADDYKVYKRSAVTAIISTAAGSMVTALIVILANYI